MEVALHTLGRLPEPIEIAAYYIVSETLTNATKHSHATTITVTVEADVADDVLRVEVVDDGVGGAEFNRGTGLIGLKDRIEALSGQIHLDSNPGAGTRLPRGASDPRHEGCRHPRINCHRRQWMPWTPGKE